jgi:2-C-methyl-D-erythritol 4-phosphate cytidylyltransferase
MGKASTVAILVAAGSGVRMGAGVPKAFIPLRGRPMLWWSLEALSRADEVDGIVVVAPPALDGEAAAALAADGRILRTVPGGATRAESVLAGLGAVPAEAERIMVHDAARPMVTPAIVGAVLAALADADGAIAATPLADTIKRVDGALAITATPDRRGLWLAQTPQAFRAGPMREAFGSAGTEALAAATDCASLLEARGGRVRVVPVGTPNLKVTTRADLRMAELLLGERPAP